MSEDKNVTDQIYEGSNLAILIDIFSYMAQTILYNLNNAASESMFHDTQMWENMNRLVRFLGYMPHGMKPASALMNIKMNSIFHHIAMLILEKWMQMARRSIILLTNLRS